MSHEGGANETEGLSRSIRIGVPDQQFPKNEIKTTRYEWYNFLPYNLMNQMRNGSNIYFFVIGLLQMIRMISPTDGYPIIFVPLTFVLSLNCLRDLIEERKRRNKDYEINHRVCHRALDFDATLRVFQKEIQVGQVLKINKDETFPADLVLLASSEKGCCYIETKDLDGESYFKRKEIPRKLYEASYNFKHLVEGESIMECEEPSKHMYHFSGVLTHGKDCVAFDNNNFLLSGASLKNTEWIIGLVVFTG